MPKLAVRVKKKRTAQNFTIANFGHLVSKSSLRPWCNVLCLPATRQQQHFQWRPLHWSNPCGALPLRWWCRFSSSYPMVKPYLSTYPLVWPTLRYRYPRRTTAGTLSTRRSGGAIYNRHGTGHQHFISSQTSK